MKLLIELLESCTPFYSYYIESEKQESTDSGFDLIIPQDITIPGNSYGNRIKLGIKCEPEISDNEKPHGYYLYPRSSIYKTPLRLANSVGIIDYSYRGEIMAIVDNHSEQDYKIEAGTRLFQLCAPDLKPIDIEIVENIGFTDRNEGGFGSTGLKGLKRANASTI